MPSLSALAVTLSCIGEQAISKQAIAKRTRKNMADYFKAILATCSARIIKDSSDIVHTALKAFPRVLVQDSTCISLPSALKKRYPGGKNNKGQKVATLKIQTILNIKNERFIALELMPFVRNEQTASWDIVAHLKPGDLLVRDLGYWVLNVFKEIIQKGAFFISRYRHCTGLLNVDDKSDFDLVKHLKKHGMLDRVLLVGKTYKIPMRVVAVPLPETVAQKRKRERKQNRDKRLHPSKDTLFLHGWAIFVTNVDATTWTPKHIAHIYRLRWRIEIIFKAWKNGMGLGTIYRQGSPYYTECIIMVKLLLIIFIHEHIWVPLIEHQQYKNLSLLKTIYAMKTLFIAAPFINTYNILSPKEWIVKSCCYEKRKRKHFYEELTINHRNLLS